MKKVILLFIALVVSSTAIAQIKIRPGVKLGFNSSRLQGLNNAESKIGINGGLFVNFDFTRFYELQIETTYSQQGTTVNRQTSGLIVSDDPIFANNTFEQDIDLQYFSIGVANKFFVMAKDHGFHFIIGPSLDINVNNNSTFFETTAIDLSFFGGVGYEFPFGLAIEARYKQGIIDIEDSSNSYYDDVDDYYTNSVFQIGAAYKFNF